MHVNSNSQISPAFQMAEKNLTDFLGKHSSKTRFKDPDVVFSLINRPEKTFYHFNSNKFKDFVFLFANYQKEFRFGFKHLHLQEYDESELLPLKIEIKELTGLMRSRPDNLSISSLINFVGKQLRLGPTNEDNPHEKTHFYAMTTPTHNGSFMLTLCAPQVKITINDLKSLIHDIVNNPEFKHLPIVQPKSDYYLPLTGDIGPSKAFTSYYVYDSLNPNIHKVFTVDYLQDILDPFSHDLLKKFGGAASLHIEYGNYATYRDDYSEGIDDTRPPINYFLEMDFLFLLFLKSYKRFSLPRATKIPSCNYNLFSSCNSQTYKSFDPNAFLPLLSKKRFSMDENNFLYLAEVAVALFNCEQYDPEAEERTWDEVYKKMSIYTARFALLDINRELLHKYIMNNYATVQNKLGSRSILTLAWYARDDSPNDFYKILGEIVWSQLFQITSEKADSIAAEACAIRLCLDFVVMSQETGKAGGEDLLLYRMENHVLKKDLGHFNRIANEISNKDSGILYRMFGQYLQRLDEIKKTEQIATGDVISQRYKAAELLKKGIYETMSKQENFSKSIIKHLYRMRLAHQGTKMKFDSDPFLFGCKNCVLQVVLIGENKRIIARAGAIEDHVTIQANVAYRPELLKTKEYKIMMKYLEIMIPQREVRNWLISHMAERLYGRNTKAALFIVGPPDAGKTTLFSLFNKDILGEYGGTAPNKLFADQDLGTSKPTPSLADAVNKRDVMIEELSGIINSEAYKNTNGGPSAQWTGRTLYEKGGASPITYHFTITMNSNPKFSSIESAVLVRTYIIQLTAHYISETDPNYPKTEEERLRKRIYPIDSQIEMKLAGLKEVFFAIIVSGFGGMYDSCTSDKEAENKPCLPNSTDLMSLAEGKFYPAHFKPLRDIPPLMRAWRRMIVDGDDFAIFVHGNICAGDASSRLYRRDILGLYVANKTNGKFMGAADFDKKMTDALDTMIVISDHDAYWPGWTLKTFSDQQAEVEAMKPIQPFFASTERQVEQEINQHPTTFYETVDDDSEYTDDEDEEEEDEEDDEDYTTECEDEAAVAAPQCLDINQINFNFAKQQLYPIQYAQ